VIFAKLIIVALVAYFGSKVIRVIDKLREKYKPLGYMYLCLSFISVLLISIVILFIIVFPYGAEHTKPLSFFAVIFSAFLGIFIAKEIDTGKISFTNAIKFITLVGLISWPVIYFVSTLIDGSIPELVLFYELGVVEFTLICLSMTLMGPLVEHLL
jgi:hypothetical protein